MLSLLLATLLTQATMSPTSDLSTNRVRATGAAGARALRDHLRTLPDAEIVASGTTTGRGFAARFAETVNVLDFGADNTGTFDTVNAVSLALAVAQDGDTLYFPQGTYRIACDGVSWHGHQLTKSGITIRGSNATIRPDRDCYFLNIWPNVQRVKITGFRIVGTLQTDGNEGGINIEQGKIAINNGSEDIEITGNRWEDSGVAVYFNGVTRLNFHHNELIRTVAGIQGGTPYGAVDLKIEDNYFLGDVTNPSTYGSDDQIAIFGPARRVSISRNFIDKQGPTSKNQAHAVLALFDGGAMQDIEILDNTFVNVATSTLIAYTAAVELRSSGGTLTGAAIRGNTFRNCNTAISVEDASKVTITDNRISSSISVSPGNWGVGIRVAGVAPHVVVERNTIDTTDLDGIVIATGSSPTIRGNLLRSIGRNAISLDNTANATVNENRLESVSGDPILLSSTAGAHVVSNRIDGTVVSTSPTIDPWAAVSVGGGDLDPDVSSVTTYVYTQTSGSGVNIRDPVSPTVNLRFTIVYRNTTGLATTVTWNAIYKLSAWGDVAAGYSRSITFRYDGTNWVEVSRTPVDVPN